MMDFSQTAEPRNQQKADDEVFRDVLAALQRNEALRSAIPGGR